MADLCGTDEAADEQQNKGAIGSATFRSSNSSRPKPSLSHHFSASGRCTLSVLTLKRIQAVLPPDGAESSHAAPRLGRRAGPEPHAPREDGEVNGLGRQGAAEVEPSLTRRRAARSDPGGQYMG